LRLHREYASILDGLLRCVCQNAPHETVGDLLNRSNTSLTALIYRTIPAAAAPAHPASEE